MMKFCTDDEVVKLTADLKNFKQNQKLNETTIDYFVNNVLYANNF
jgi:hypothetical protein